MGDWRDNLVEQRDRIRDIADTARRVAVLGIKPDDHLTAPAHYVPAYLAEAGLEVIPVPVYYPNVHEYLGRPAVRDLRSIEGGVDIVCVFRRSPDVPPHVDDLVALAPRTVWLQSGIRHAEAAERLARADILVVQDRCLMVEHRIATRG